MVYYALVESLFSYDIIVWGSIYFSNVKSPVNTQKSLFKISFGKLFRYPTAHFFNETQMLNVRQTYVRSVLMFCTKTYH